MSGAVDPVKYDGWMAGQVYAAQSDMLDLIWTHTAMRPRVNSVFRGPPHTTAPEITEITLTWSEFVSLITPILARAEQP